MITDDLAEVLAYADVTGDPEAVFIVDDVESPAPAPVIEDGKLIWDQVLEIGQAVQIKYTVTVKAGMEGKIVTNRAHGSGTPPGLPPIETPEVSVEHPVPGYEIAKEAAPPSGTFLNAGTVVTYTVTGTNTGATALNEVTIEDDMSAVLNKATLEGAPSATIVGPGGGPTTAPTMSGTTLSWVGELAIGQKIVLTYQVKINPDAYSTTINNAVTSHATPPGVPTIKPPPVKTTHQTNPEPEKLVVTGAQLAGISALTVLTLGLGAAITAVNRRRKKNQPNTIE